MEYEVDILVTSRDRHSELFGLLQSLRTQTFKKWNIIILDDGSGTPIMQSFVATVLLNRIKLEGHKVKIVRQEQSYGVCHARNRLIDEQLKWNTGAQLCLRCDDDVLLEPDYIERLVKVIEEGYDLASGVVPHIAHPEVKREISKVKPIINLHRLDEEGNLIENRDECGFSYLDNEIVPTPHFRTNCLYKKEVHEKVRHPTNLTPVGFREEGFFSFKAILSGYKIGIDTGAIAYHLQTPSGGCRYDQNVYAQNVQIDEKTWRDWIKTMFEIYGDFFQKYYDEVTK